MPRLYYAIRVFGAVVGIASFLFLVAQGVPAGDSALPGKRVRLTHTTRSGCPERCKEPQKVETKVTLSSTPATLANDPSPIEKAVDNDAGVLVIRLLVALLTALATATTLERLLRGPGSTGPPDDEKRPIEPGPEGDPNAGSPTTEEKSEEEKKEAEDAKRRKEHEATAAKQAHLKEVSGKRKLKINP